MTTKELGQLRWLDRELQMQQRRLAVLEAEAARAGVPAAHWSGPLAKERAGYLACLQRRAAERERLLRFINETEDSLLRQILTYRYLDGMSWWDVADAVGGNMTADSVKKAVYRHLGQ